MKRVMVFGVFDGFHEGHRAFLKQARACGDYLVVAVTQDHIVEELKGRLPFVSSAERIERVKREDGVDEVVVGDEELGKWEVLARHRPHVIALGYDQKDLRKSLEQRLPELDWQIEIRLMEPFEPEKYKSSLLKSKPKS